MKTKFEKSFHASLESCRSLPMQRLLKELFPEMVRFFWADSRLDKMGSDLVVVLPDRQIHIDVKIRSDDPREWGEDDIAVELYSVVEKKKRGYQNEVCDYLLWGFEKTQRAVLVPFKPFQTYHAKYFAFWEKWRAELPQTTVLKDGTTYHSTFCFVPFDLIKPIAKEAIA